MTIRLLTTCLNIKRLSRYSTVGCLGNRCDVGGKIAETSEAASLLPLQHRISCVTTETNWAVALPSELNNDEMAIESTGMFFTCAKDITELTELTESR
jgi:hypothetical protein